MDTWVKSKFSMDQNGEKVVEEWHSSNICLTDLLQGWKETYGRDGNWKNLEKDIFSLRQKTAGERWGNQRNSAKTQRQVIGYVKVKRVIGMTWVET